MPIGPLVRKSISLIRIWMIVPKASVTIARYGPVTRSAGNARIAPNSAVTAIAITGISTNGVSGKFVMTTPAAYAPIPNRPAWPSETWPV
jgi:hypothetical protein